VFPSDRSEYLDTLFNPRDAVLGEPVHVISTPQYRRRDDLSTVGATISVKLAITVPYHVSLFVHVAIPVSIVTEIARFGRPAVDLMIKREVRVKLGSII
jgi:hypothetical protein